MEIFFIIVIVLVLIVAFASIKVVRQSEVRIVERLGKYHNTAEAGLNFILPLLIKLELLLV